jgi:hypothetical protein
VSSISLIRKAQIVAQVVGRQAGQSRTAAALIKAGKATAQSFGRVLHQLWLEVTGFIFLFMALVGGIAVVREYTRYQAGRTGPGRAVMAVCFCLTFGYFGLSSFWRVRKKRI